MYVLFTETYAILNDYIWAIKVKCPRFLATHSPGCYPRLHDQHPRVLAWLFSVRFFKRRFWRETNFIDIRSFSHKSRKDWTRYLYEHLFIFMLGFNVIRWSFRKGAKNRQKSSMEHQVWPFQFWNRVPKQYTYIRGH